MILPFFALQMCFACAGMAANLDGVDFPDTIQAGSQALVLNGLGQRLATMLKVRVYVAGLYLPQKSSDADGIIRSGGPKRVVLKFERDISAKQSREAWEESLKKIGSGFPNIADRIPRLLEAMSDMKKGDETVYSFTDDKVEIFSRGELKATIRGRDFSEALFTVWLKNPPNPELAKGLLGK